MNLRSLLFVPGDRPERMAKAMGTAARALILDLEDAVAHARKVDARNMVAEFLGTAKRGPKKLFVRVNPLDSGLTDDDLATVIPAAPDGIVFPKAEGGAALAELEQRIARLEAQAGLPPGQIAILPIATETPAAMFLLGSYGGVTDRLVGLTWGAEDLPAAIGASGSREADGSFTPPYEIARALTLFGAAAADVAPIETVFPNFRDLDALAAYAARGRRDGFTGMMAIHPAQVDIIEAAFAPSEEELAFARRVVAAFAENPGSGALQLDGKMIDFPHLKQARRVLEMD
ncbi:CoA ester lyase [Sphingobium sp. DEHP117]|uniref:HpcH/HpaI aldolase/citrate lyase family protein n=1 Tax=Sphingobium sp. DEHP117 TaxID=2993436 RepID=UPI0027D60ADA|nr:aldolase/citrate lyase family protein [Sphingobium sp. DEHP117]MDQ4420575.1 CoA ester lyase [Sphingobium sp. DEHP117]